MLNSSRGTVAPLAALALVAGGAVLAEEKAATTPDTPGYDTRAEYAVRGTITEVKTHRSLTGYTDVHILIATAYGDLEVHVGPAAYLSKRGFVPVKGDEVMVTGAKTTFEEKPVLVAREIRKGGKCLTVRDMSGHPLWPKGIRG